MTSGNTANHAQRAETRSYVSVASVIFMVTNTAMALGLFCGFSSLAHKGRDIEAALAAARIAMQKAARVR